MRKIINFVLDSTVQIAQIALILIPLLFTDNLLNLLTEILRNFDFYFLDSSERIIFQKLIFSFGLYLFFKKSNEKRIFNYGTSHYHDKPYIWYWFCSKILGYKICSLIRVPIHLQFKLIVRETFEHYKIDEEFIIVEHRNTTIKKYNSENNTSLNFNLIIQDTYPIDFVQIPKSLCSNCTIAISREIKKIGERVYSESLVDDIVEQINLLPENSILHIFATTNPKTNYSIAKKILSLGGRGKISKIYIYQQSENEKRHFLNKPYQI